MKGELDPLSVWTKPTPYCTVSRLRDMCGAVVQILASSPYLDIGLQYSYFVVHPETQIPENQNPKSRSSTSVIISN